MPLQNRRERKQLFDYKSEALLCHTNPKIVLVTTQLKTANQKTEITHVSSKFSDWSGKWLCEASIETVEDLESVRENPPLITAAIFDSSIRIEILAELYKMVPVKDT